MDSLLLGFGIFIWSMFGFFVLPGPIEKKIGMPKSSVKRFLLVVVLGPLAWLTALAILFARD